MAPISRWPFPGASPFKAVLILQLVSFKFGNAKVTTECQLIQAAVEANAKTLDNMLYYVVLFHILQAYMATVSGDGSYGWYIWPFIDYMWFKVAYWGSENKVLSTLDWFDNTHIQSILLHAHFFSICIFLLSKELAHQKAPELLTPVYH